MIPEIKNQTMTFTSINEKDILFITAKYSDQSSKIISQLGISTPTKSGYLYEIDGTYIILTVDKNEIVL